MILAHCDKQRGKKKITQKIVTELQTQARRFWYSDKQKQNKKEGGGEMQ